jgi:hypothetical protein
MKTPFRLVAVLLSLSALHQSAAAADKPSDLLVGKWKDRAEPADAIIQFLKDGTGDITETTAEKTNRVGISWKVTRTFGNACVVVVKYDVPKAKEGEQAPKEAPSFTWLVAFDGKDAFVTQAKQNEITTMVRQQSPRKSVRKTILPVPEGEG